MGAKFKFMACVLSAGKLALPKQRREGDRCVDRPFVQRVRRSDTHISQEGGRRGSWRERGLHGRRI